MKIFFATEISRSTVLSKFYVLLFMHGLHMVFASLYMLSVKIRHYLHVTQVNLLAVLYHFHYPRFCVSMDLTEDGRLSFMSLVRMINAHTHTPFV